MSDATTRSSPRRTLHNGLTRLREAVGVATDGWGARFLFVCLGGVYVLLYLIGFGDLWITAAPGPLTIRVGAEPLRAFAVDGLGRFGSVGVVYLGGLGLTYLVSPLNVLVALLLAGLVGTNGALTYRGIRQPSGERLRISTVVLAGIPPVLLAAAILGPTFVYLLGIEGSGAIPLGLRLLVPIAALLLLWSISRISRRIPSNHE